MRINFLEGFDGLVSSSTTTGYEGPGINWTKNSEPNTFYPSGDPNRTAHEKFDVIVGQGRNSGDCYSLGKQRVSMEPVTIGYTTSAGSYYLGFAVKFTETPIQYAKVDPSFQTTSLPYFVRFGNSYIYLDNTAEDSSPSDPPVLRMTAYVDHNVDVVPHNRTTNYGTYTMWQDTNWHFIEICETLDTEEVIFMIDGEEVYRQSFPGAYSAYYGYASTEIYNPFASGTSSTFTMYIDDVYMLEYPLGTYTDPLEGFLGSEIKIVHTPIIGDGSTNDLSKSNVSIDYYEHILNDGTEWVGDYLYVEFGTTLGATEYWDQLYKISPATLASDEAISGIQLACYTDVEDLSEYLNYNTELYLIAKKDSISPTIKPIDHDFGLVYPKNSATMPHPVMFAFPPNSTISPTEITNGEFGFELVSTKVRS